MRPDKIVLQGNKMKLQKRIDWKNELNEIVTLNNGTSSRRPNAVSSYATQKKRRETLFSAFADLRTLGYKLESVRNIKTKHVRAVVHYWIKEGQSPSTVQNKISILRVFCGWIGKGGMLPESKYLADEDQAHHVTRSYLATVDKSWSGKDIDFEATIKQIAESDPVIAMQLELQRAFGLRRKESWMLRPKSNLEGGMLHVLNGTKGGRTRMVPVRTEYQRELLGRACQMAGNGSLIPPHYSLAKWESHYNWVMHREQITRKGLRVTSHGLRHEYAHERYADRLGVEAPVKGGGRPDMDTDAANAEKRWLSRELGHSRPQIIGCYSGSPQKSKADGGKAEIERPSPNDAGRKSAGRGLALSEAEMEDAH